MRQLYLSFLLLCLLTVLARSALRLAYDHGPEDTPLGLAYQSPDAESLLAMGGKISLQEAGLYELELVPGLAATLAQNILAKKTEILAKASGLPPQERPKALELAHGVGPKTAEKLSRYLKLD